MAASGECTLFVFRDATDARQFNDAIPASYESVHRFPEFPFHRFRILPFALNPPPTQTPPPGQILHEFREYPPAQAVVLFGMDWILQAGGVDVLSLSLAPPGSAFDSRDPWQIATHTAHEMGIPGSSPRATMARQRAAFSRSRKPRGSSQWARLSPRPNSPRSRAADGGAAPCRPWLRTAILNLLSLTSTALHLFHSAPALLLLRSLASSFCFRKFSRSSKAIWSTPARHSGGTRVVHSSCHYSESPIQGWTQGFFLKDLNTSQKPLKTGSSIFRFPGRSTKRNGAKP